MAAVKLPAWPKGIAGNVWANKLADASVYAVESEAINYDTGTAVTIFSIPEDSILLGVALEVQTAFDKPQGSIVVQDTLADIVKFADRAFGDTGYTYAPVLRRYAKVAGVGNTARAIQVDVNGGTGTAGVGRIWLMLKPNRGSLRKDFV